MTNEQILKKAILKAYPDKKFQDQEDLADYVKGQLERDEGYRLIFWHDFAEKFWGKKIVWYAVVGNLEICYESKCNSGNLYKPAWQYHLQQMVLEKEPLKYLEEFL